MEPELPLIILVIDGNIAIRVGYCEAIAIGIILIVVLSNQLLYNFIEPLHLELVLGCEVVTASLLHPASDILKL